jgi:hypothetical protein
MLALVLPEERFGEPAETEEGVDVLLRGARAQLARRERMQPEVAIPVGEGVAALAIVVETGGPRDDDPTPGFLGVGDSLHQIPPAGVLVDLVQDDEGFVRRQLDPPERAAARGSSQLK